MWLLDILAQAPLARAVGSDFVSGTCGLSALVTPACKSKAELPAGNSCGILERIWPLDPSRESSAVLLAPQLGAVLGIRFCEVVVGCLLFPRDRLR